MAFTQLLVAGMALATRFEESRQVRVVEKVVVKSVIVRLPTHAELSPPPPNRRWFPVRPCRRPRPRR